jgi:hypothetical protein
MSGDEGGIGGGGIGGNGCGDTDPIGFCMLVTSNGIEGSAA